MSQRRTDHRTKRLKRILPACAVSMLGLATLAACASTASKGSDIGRSGDPDAPSEVEARRDANEPSPEASPSAPAGEKSVAAKAEATPRGPLELEVPEFGPAVVVPPNANARPAPILVAAHGAGDSPEWQCEHWGPIVRGRYFVLCPRGASLGGGGYYYANHFALERELLAALDAVERSYGSWVRPDGGVYTGYSQGATMGALMVIEHGAKFPYLVLVEGGTAEWSASRAKRYAKSGGKSVALVCGGSGCMKRAQASAKILERAGLRARVEHAEGGGHTYVGVVGERATDLLENWLFATD
jgi:predicted esterase